MRRKAVIFGLAAIVSLPALAADSIHLSIEAKAETLTGGAAASLDTFQSAHAVVPKLATVQIQNGRLSLTIEPSSVTVVSIEQ